jgi:hypothetical protein
MTAGRREHEPRGCVQCLVALEIRNALEASEEEFDRALRVAGSAGWLNINPGKLHSVCIARYGWKLVQRRRSAIAPASSCSRFTTAGL